MAGNVVFSATQWLATVAIARLGSREMLGEFALGLAIAQPVFAATSLQLRAIYVTDTANKWSRGRMIRLRSVLSVLALCLILLSLFFVSWNLATKLIVALVALRSGSDSLSDIYYGEAQKHHRLDVIAVLMSLRGMLGLIVLCGGLYLTASLWKSLLLSTCLWMGFLWWVERRWASNRFPEKKQSRVDSVWLLISAGLPLSGTLFFLNAGQSVPRLLLQRVAGPGELGVFAAAATLSGAIGLFVNAVAQTLLPMLAEAFETDVARYTRLLKNTLAICLTIALICILISIAVAPMVLGLIYGAGYKAGATTLVILLLASTLSNISTILGAGATAANEYRPQLLVSAGTLATSLICSATMIPRWHLMGAAVAVTVAALAQTGGYCFICFRSSQRAMNTRRVPCLSVITD